MHNTVITTHNHLWLIHIFVIFALIFTSDIIDHEIQTVYLCLPHLMFVAYETSANELNGNFVIWNHNDLYFTTKLLIVQ